ncbi:PIN-like domain-containing protein [Microcoleus sp. MON1_C1]|uniref:PIN-like domain-containing protein n=1 Tax=Microcoleus sp. MON1_C1 TaxID=2818827 RepID=UPI004040A409
MLRFYSTKPADPDPIESAQVGLVWGASRLAVCGRFATATRERFFEILNHLKKQIWILYQATYEYQQNRL